MVNESQNIIHKVCRMYCENEEHQKDLFQEILLQLWRSFPSFRGDAKFSTWMYRVALNVAIQDVRKQKKRKLLFLDSYEIKPDTLVSMPYKEDDRLKSLYKAISMLDKVERAIMMLHLDGIQNKEIADIIGISQNYVRVKMTRIRKKLSEILTTE